MESKIPIPLPNPLLKKGEGRQGKDNFVGVLKLN